MELINSTRMVAGYTMGMEPSGRELLVVVIKGTFRIPVQSGETLRLHEEQQPLVMSDVFFAEPGLSAPRYEVDFAPRKHRCDVLLNATAYAPEGRPATRVTVGARIGSWSKSFDVVGDRVWEAGLGGIGASVATPFVQMPIRYDRAFGGTDNKSDDPADHVAYLPNPVGRGFHKRLKSAWIDGSPLPNTQESDRAVSWVDGDYRPMSFGAIGRHWEPRYKYAGTYDQHWLDHVFPFLPADFDEQYYQAAPLDQQLPKPLGELAAQWIGVDASGRLADPLLRARIAQFEVDEAAFRLTMTRTRELARSGGVHPAFSSVLKLYGAELNKRRYELLMAAGGSDALEWESARSHQGASARGWLRTKANSIEGGTSEVQLNIIAKRLLELPDA